MMILSPREDECLLWMMVLENILDVVDPSKLESATGGEWRAAIARCVALLQGDTGTTSHLSLWLRPRLIMFC
jgi:nucleolar pre-ribosomal-associated protein 1